MRGFWIGKPFLSLSSVNPSVTFLYQIDVTRISGDRLPLLSTRYVAEAYYSRCFSLIFVSSQRCEQPMARSMNYA
jgi:hypothetical protein